MNKRENNSSKTVSKSSIKKEENRIKNIMHENVKSEYIDKDTNNNLKKNKNKKNNFKNNDDNNNDIFINTNHYSNMLENIENEKFYINNEFIKDCNNDTITRTTARKKENKELLNTYVNTNKVFNKKNRNKNRLEKELNISNYNE